MELIATGFEGLFVIQPRIFRDERGYFFESWNKDQFASHGLFLDFVQDNQSMSTAGVLRGLHFQHKPWEQGKLVRVLQGAVLDVVVDLRKDQPTFGQHFKLHMNAQDHTMLWIPPGFAHGFLTLEDQTIFVYKCTKAYNRDAEGSIAWNDPDLAIDWGYTNPMVSDKDSKAMLFKTFVSPF